MINSTLNQGIAIKTETSGDGGLQGMLKLIISLILALFCVAALPGCNKKKSGGDSNKPGDATASALPANEKDAALQFACREKNNIWDTKTQECYTPEAFCALQTDGSVWRNGRCMTLKDQCLETTGAGWEKDACRTAEQVCKEKNDGSQWVNNSCLTQEELCKEKAAYFKWDSSKQCIPKVFLDYCQDVDASKEIKYTIGRFKALAVQTGCQETQKWFAAQTEIRLTMFIDPHAADAATRDRITDIAPISEFKNIKKLVLTDNRIMDLSPIGALTSLEYLDLGSNLVTIDIGPLANLTHLVELYAINNKVTDASPLAKLTTLTFLDLTANRLDHVDDLKGLTNLKTLYIGGNPIRSVAPLVTLTNLQEISLTYTPLTTEKNTEDTCPTTKGPAPLTNFCKNPNPTSD